MQISGFSARLFALWLAASSCAATYAATDEIAPGSSSPRISTPVALHWLWNEKETDSAYTVNRERREWLIHERGYVDMGPIAYVEEKQLPRTQPLTCFYSGPPKTNTFCSISALEQRLVRSLGYKQVSVEGFVFDRRVEGTVALYRVSRSWGDGKDREHRFVTSNDELLRLRKLIWTYDGAKGFVYPVR